MDNPVKRARQNAGLTQKELADKCCTTQQAVQQWESGKTIPQRDRWEEIAKALGCSIYDISFLDDNPSRHLIVDIDYSAQWNETINKLYSLHVTNDLEKFIKTSAIRYAEEEKQYRKGTMIYHLCLSEVEHDIYKYWDENVNKPIGEKGTSFWKCFFPQDFFLTTSEFHPLVAAKSAAIIEGLAGFQLLIGQTDELSEEYYPELI